MRRKFLEYAIVSCLVASLITPGVNAFTDSSTNFSRISVSSDITLTISLSGFFKSYTYSGFSTTVSNDYASFSITPTDFIKIQDFTGIAGHEVDLAFNSNSWTYGGSDFGKNDLRNFSSDSTTTADAIRFRIVTDFTSHEWSAKDTLLCSADSSTMVMNQIVVTANDQELAQNSSSCAGYSTYRPSMIDIMGPSNGFGAGEYTQSGTFTLSDGFS